MKPNPHSYRLPVGYHDLPFIAPRARTRRRLYGKRGNQVVTGNQPLPSDVTVLRHCRCMDCLNFSNVGADYFCSEYIGGTKVTWVTGKRICDPPPDAWHYCSLYHGVQSSRDSDCSLGMDSDCRPARTPNAVSALTGMQSGRDSNCSLGADSKCSLRPDSFCSLRPQVSKDVWVWPKATHQAAQVGAGSTIAPEAEQLDDDEELI